MANDAFKLIISTSFFNNNERFLELDTCTSKKINSTAEIAKHPLQDGSVFADHMYSNPDKFTVSGTFSLNGRQQYEGSECYSADNILDGITEEANIPEELKALTENNRLKNIQEVFEYIKKAGLLCSLTTLKGNETSNEVRFKRRDNMAISEIDWTENYNSLDFSITFKEIIQVKNQVYKFDNYSDLYPNSNMPSSKSFAQMLVDEGILYKYVLEILLDKGYIDKKDLMCFTYYNSVSSRSDVEVSMRYFKTVLLSIGAYLSVGLYATGSAIAAGLIGTGSTLLSSTGIGLVIAGVVFAIWAIFAAIEEGRKADRLKRGFNLIQNYANYVNDDGTLKDGVDISTAKENKVGLGKLKILLDDIQNVITKEFTDISVYGIAENETDNEDRTLPIIVNNDLCYFTFEKDTTTKSDYADFTWNLKVLDGADENAKEVDNGFGWPMCSSFDECSRNTNSVYIDSTREYEVYLFGPGINVELLKQYLSTDALGTLGISPTITIPELIKQQVAKQQYLCNYQLIVVKGSAKEKIKKLNDIIVDTMSKLNYD